MAESSVPITAGSGTAIDVYALPDGKNQQAVAIGDGANNGVKASIFSPSSELRVATEGTQMFFDAFDSGLDTLFKWKPPTASGGGVAATSVAGSGSTTLSSGSTLNGFSLLESQAAFQATDPGWLYQRVNLNIEFAVLTTGYRFWGRGQTPAAPTIATPLNEAVGWEITTAGKLFAVMYAGSTRTFAADLSSSGTNKQPADSSAHDYMVWFKGNYMYWAIDSPDNIVATQTTGANGPNYNNLPVKLLCVSNSGTAVTLAINSIVLGDTGRNNVSISNSASPWKTAIVGHGGGLRVSSGIPRITQQKSAVSSGSVASLAVTFDAINTVGNTVIVSCGVGNGTAPTVTDTSGNTYTRAANVANGTALNTSVFVASNVYSGARNTITVNNGGTTASIAVEVYEVDGLLTVVNSVVDVLATASGTSTTPATAALTPATPNDYVFAAIGVGTAAQTITPAANWSNDSGQLNPTTPAGLFSFASISQFLGSLSPVTPSSTIVSEPWGMAAVAFRAALIGIEGAVRLTDGTSNVSVKPASTAAVAADLPLVVALHPTSPLPTGGNVLGTVAVNGFSNIGVSTTGDTGAKTVTFNGATQTNASAKGVTVVFNVGTVSGTTPTLVAKLQVSADGGTTWVDLPAATTASLVATGVWGIQVYPGIAALAGTTTTGTMAAVSAVLPKTWRIVYTIGGTTPSFTLTNVQVSYHI